MTKITAILFILGSIWVPFALALLLGPLVKFVTQDQEWEIYDSVAFCALAGFWVWFGWGWRCLTGRFPLVSPRQFWMISFVTHLGWLAFFFGDGSIPPISLWFITNMVVAAIGMLPESRGNGWRSKVVRTLEYVLCMPIALVAGVALADDGFCGQTMFFLVVAVLALSWTVLRIPRQVEEYPHATSGAANSLKRS